MNFNRVALKTKAKKLLKQNYGWILLVTIIFSLTSSTFSMTIGNDDIRDIFTPKVNVNQNDGFSNSDRDVNIYTPGGIIQYDPYEAIREYKYRIEDRVRNWFPFYHGSVWALIGLFSMIVGLLSVLLKVFVLNPIQVGCMKWYLKNREEDKPKLRVIVEMFSSGYLRVVGIMFLRDLYTFLWTLLLIVPGIVKSYEYRMIPYLLAENKDITRKEAFGMTKRIMDGNKMDTFVLDLSFIPWILLSIMLCGILSVLYVAPYMALTRAELYVCLCQGREKYESTI